MSASDGVLPVCVKGSGVQPHHGTAGGRGTGGDGMHPGRDIGRFSEKEQGGGREFGRKEIAFRLFDKNKPLENISDTLGISLWNCTSNMSIWCSRRQITGISKDFDII